MPSAKIYTAVLSCITASILSACVNQPVKSNLKGRDDNSSNILNLLDPSVTTEAEAFSRGEAALAEGKTDNALFYYVKTLQYNKKNIKALEKIALIHSQSKHPELARNIYKEILGIDNTNPFANENIGLHLLENGNAPQAKGYLIQAVKHGNRQWKSHNGLGVIADLEHNSAEAIAHFEAALAIEPANPMLLNNLGFTLYRAGDELKAKQLFNQALGFDNKNQRAISNLALIEIKHGAYASAVALFNRVMSPHEALNNVGYLCMLNGQYEVAEEFFTRAIDESPVYFPKAQENLNNLQTQRKNRTPYQAITEAAPKIEPETRPDFSAEPPATLQPTLETKKVEKPKGPEAKNNKGVINRIGSPAKTSKAKQFAATADKKKNRLEAKAIAKREVPKSVSGKAQSDNQKNEVIPPLNEPEQKESNATQTAQVSKNKNATGDAAAVSKTEETKSISPTESPKPVDSAKVLESPKINIPSPAPAESSALAIPANAGAANLPAEAKSTVSLIPKTEEAKPETHSEPANPTGQAKVLNPPKTNAAIPSATETSAETMLANPQSPQQIKPTQGMAANLPQPDNTQQPTPQP
jgi:Tfp pilus assembly protein PilF